MGLSDSKIILGENEVATISHSHRLSCVKHFHHLATENKNDHGIVKQQLTPRQGTVWSDPGQMFWAAKHRHER